jgi:hypothetical protein
MIDAAEPADATAKAEQMESIEPMDAMEPTEPIDRIDPRDAIESMESSDHRDHRDRAAIGLSPRGGAAQPLPLGYGDKNQAPPRAPPRPPERREPMRTVQAPGMPLRGSRAPDPHSTRLAGRPPTQSGHEPEQQDRDRVERRLYPMVELCVLA